MSLIVVEPLPRRAHAGQILAWLCEQGGLDAKRVGNIEIRGRRATVEVPDGWEGRLVKALDGTRLGEDRVRVCSDGAASVHEPDDHFHRLRQLLDLESRGAAERVRNRARRNTGEKAERSGQCLVDLAIQELESGLAGRVLVTLTKAKLGQSLPWTRLGVGAPIILSSQTDATREALRGVVCQRRERSIQIALERLPDEQGEQETWRLDLSDDEVGADRARAALERARLARGDRLARLREALLGQRDPEFHPAQTVQLLDESLHTHQQTALERALAARDLALIHGPPGTGKTTVLVELVRQAVQRGERVLVAAPSNLAVDNLLERLLAWGVRAVRLGHPARVLASLQSATLDLMVDEHKDLRLARKLTKEALALFRQASRWTRARPQPGEKRDLRNEARQRLADARHLEAQAVEQVLDAAQVVCGTTTGLDSEVLGTRHFDLGVIDEACQTTEPACWIVVQRCERLVLAGDHRQLPPTVISTQALEQGFGISLFERLAARWGSQATWQLTRQFRMHEAIMDFSSREFYDGSLEPDASVARHRLCDLPGVRTSPLTESVLQLLDTAGAGYEEELEPDGESRLNPQEAALAIAQVRALLDCGLHAEQVAIITPYAAQVRRLRELWEAAPIGSAELEIDTVDGFQGREKEAIVISLVRSNTQGEIGFLADLRRTNVAWTRARRKLVVIGDSATLGADPFYRRMFEYFEERGAYGTVWEWA